MRDRHNRFRLDELKAGIKPFRLHFFSRLRSTNDHAALLRKRGELFAPAIVLTNHQLAGRGRGSNTWWSTAGCLTVTFVLPVEEHLEAHQVPLVAGLAARDAAAVITGDDSIAIKWPNDLLHNGKKLAGLLCERVHKADLIGLGLNVNVDPRRPPRPPRALRQQITSLRAITGDHVDISQVLSTVSRYMYRALSRRGERPFAEVLQRYDAHHALVGRRVVIEACEMEQAIRGTCDGLDRHGRLILRDASKTRHIVAGQVRLLP